ncbi:SWIM zinc finger family protein [Haloparvum sedimenti]|uniref:SWIM zinc finger family protein n=1 Tax=Haloparvum sedimenti TaxID=1678448 RepID=UPI00071E77A8|nr:SWIM zinc finger family protein [Haloparvum sedimenti]
MSTLWEWSTLDSDTGERLDFQRLAGTEETSWQRGEPRAASIKRASRIGWRVALPGGEPHTVALAIDGGEWTGYCDCKGFKFNAGPCAHLCTLRKAAFGGLPDDRGNRVTVAHADEARDAETSLPALSFLTEREREIYVETQISGMGVREWARREEVSPGTASNLLRSARDRIEEHETQLRADGGPDVRRDPATDARRVGGEGVDR